MALGVVASFKDGWMFRPKIAAWVGCSVRTVGRSFEQGRSEGLLRTARGKKNEVPPGAKAPLWCGFTHRWLPGWGLAGKAVGVEVAKNKARFLARRVVKSKPMPIARAPERRRWTAAELDAELDRLAARRAAPPAPDPEPPERPPPE
jgi:hypothetical protein